MENRFWAKIAGFLERLAEFNNSTRSLLVEVDDERMMLVLTILTDGKRYSYREHFRLNAFASIDLDKALDWMIDRADRVHLSPKSDVGGD